jgi:hypothetical protein
MTIQEPTEAEMLKAEYDLKIIRLLMCDQPHNILTVVNELIDRKKEHE